MCHSVLNGSLHSWIILEVFALAQIAFILLLPCHYSHICPVSLKFGFIRNNSYFGEFSLRGKQDPKVLCFPFFEIVCDMDEVSYCCLQFF